MAGQLINISGSPCFIDYHDGEGSAVMNGREYRWEFHHYCGPTFIRKDGDPMKIQPCGNHPVWPHFNAWLGKYLKMRENATLHEIVSC